MRKPKSPSWLLAAKAQNRSPGEDFQWLSRALANAGVMPLDEAEAAIAAGRIKVNGKTQTHPMSALRPKDRVDVDGRPVSVAPHTLAVMLHKPESVVSAKNDPEGQGTIFEVFQRAIPPELQRYGWHAIGRLDRNTTGLLLFTNDQKLVAFATSPTTHLSKRYVAKVSGKVTEKKLAKLRAGIELDDGMTLPAEAQQREPQVVELTLTEGRHHQVKRMLGALGMPVLALHREAIGQLELDVAVGCTRVLTDEELADKLGYPPQAPR